MSTARQRSRASAASSSDDIPVKDDKPSAPRLSKRVSKQQPETDQDMTPDAPGDESSQDTYTSEENTNASHTSLLHQASLALPASSIIQQHKQAGVGGLPASVTPPVNIARFSTMGPHGSSFVAPPTAFSRQLSRLPSTSHTGVFSGNEWRTGVAVEERINIRRKLREAYLKHCPTYEQLMDTVVAVDEELLFSCSSNRIDYLKASIDWDSRIQLKRQQLKSNSNANGTAAASAAASGSANGELSKKRSVPDDLSGSSVSLLEIAINNSDLLPAESASVEIPPISQLTGIEPAATQGAAKKQRNS